MNTHKWIVADLPCHQPEDGKTYNPAHTAVHVEYPPLTKSHIGRVLHFRHPDFEGLTLTTLADRVGEPQSNPAMQDMRARFFADLKTSRHEAAMAAKARALADPPKNQASPPSTAPVAPK